MSPLLHATLSGTSVALGVAGSIAMSITNRSPFEYSVQVSGEALRLFLVFSVMTPTLAYAYVDPGSGSAIVTMVLGLIAAISYSFRKFFYNIKRRLFGGSDQTEKQSPNE